MCGICGIYYFNQKERKVDPVQLQQMAQTIYHRGPDDQKFYIGENVGLAARRLSIIDLVGGQQPVANEDKTIWITYNGEIYNYLELREHLIKKGHVFSAKSDTETIVHLYEEYGEDCVKYLRGMFAFALWDSRHRKLILARDRVGIKPLFYTKTDTEFLFASEIKCILKIRDTYKEIDLRGLDAYFTLSYIPAPLTIFKNIHKLLPGHILICDENGITIKNYWDLYIEPDYGKSEKFFIEGFMDLLEESVKIRLMSEVPLGVFLSGGVDSSTVAALAVKNSSTPVNTFTIGFGGQIGAFDDERKYARLIAARYGTNHKEFEVLPDCIGIIEKIVSAFDEPFADDSTIPSYYVSELASQYVTVLLSGLGGDELFGGYERYLGFILADRYSKVPLSFRKKLIDPIILNLPESKNGNYTINHLKRFIRSSGLRPDQRYFGFISLLNNERRKNLYHPDLHAAIDYSWISSYFASYFNQKNIAAPMNKVFYQDIHTYLPDDILALTDRIGMHHSLEIRVPFLDHKLMEFCFRIPPEIKIKHFRKKYLLKKAVRDLLPSKVLSHKKQGFVGPMSMWLRQQLKPYVSDILCKKNINRIGFFNAETVKSILAEHFTRKETHDTLIWALINFHVWYDHYM